VEHAEGQADAARVQTVIDGATYGLEASLEALRQRRAQMVVYAEGFRAPGGECPRCQGLFSPEVDGACPYDAAPLLAYDDVVERAIARAGAWGASVEPVRGDAAARLVGSGGIGVLRRF
jgi:peptide subunit release factor 1 (eRF1)